MAKEVVTYTPVPKITIISKATNRCEYCGNKATFDYGREVEVSRIEKSAEGDVEIAPARQFWCNNCIHSAEWAGRDTEEAEQFRNRPNVPELVTCQE